MLPNLIVALYALLPVALLTSASLPSGVFYALIAACLALLVQKRFAGAREQTYRYRWLIASYSVLFLAVASSSIYYGDWAGANSEGALRFFLGLWVLLLALPYIDPIKLRYALWGMGAAGLVSTSILLWLIAQGNPRPFTPGLILTTYSSLMLLLGALTIYSIKWQLTVWPMLEKSLKILVGVATFGGFLMAQTRTGLLGLPVLLLLGILLFVGGRRPVRMLGLLFVSGVVLLAVVGGNDALRGRAEQGVKEVQACQGESSTSQNSMCIRLQLWRSAIDAGVSHPWVGLGDGGRYAEYLESVALRKGLVSQVTVDTYFGEPHNDLLLLFAGFGFPGALGLLLIYAVPNVYFLSRVLSRDTTQNAKTAAIMGVALCMSFALFGLTETMFRRMNTIGFYVALVGLFMVLSSKPNEVSAKI